MVGKLEAVLELNRLGVEVRSVEEARLDMRVLVRPLLMVIFSWVAEHEGVRPVERTHAGIESASTDKRIGRPPAAINVTAARALREDGASLDARPLGVSRRRSIGARRARVSQTGAREAGL